MNTTDTLAVSATGLVKTFGDQRAVDGIDLEVRRGEVFGVLGPNGAGKTTMLKMLATLLPIDGGSAEIFGHDVRREGHVIRQLLGVTGQYASVDENLTATENLLLFGRLQGLSRGDSRRRAGHLLEQFDLTEAASKPISAFSGGMRRRLDLAASLITRPPLIFLDEPTTGLDPRTRGQMWDTIRELVTEGCTVLLTTQYLDEADQLADRIAVIDRGVKVAQGTSDELKSSVGRSTLMLHLTRPRRPREGRRRRPAARRRGRRSVARVAPARRAAGPQRPGGRRPRRPARAGDRHRVAHRPEALPRRGVHGPHRSRHRHGFLRQPVHHHAARAGGRIMTTTTTTTQPNPSDAATTSTPSVAVARSLPGAELSRHVSLAETISQTGTMAWRATMKMRRNFEQLFDVTIQPLLFTAMFAYIFGGAISGSVKDYLPIIIPGLIGQTVLTACVATGVQLREDMDKGVFDRFKVLPIARIAPLAGPMVADLVRYTIASSLTFATGIAMGYRPGGGVFGVLGAILLAIVAGWSLAWIFTWFGTIGKTAQGVQGISLMVMFPLTFLSNAFVPTDTMPSWLRAFADVNPVSLVISAIRDLANDGAVTGQVGWALLGCVVVIAIFAPLSVRSFNRKM